VNPVGPAGEGLTGHERAGFVPPVYPYERLAGARKAGEAHPGGLVDLSIGTPTDPPAPAVVAALGASGAERGYPGSVGTLALRQACAAWMARRFGVELADAELAGSLAVCVGTKEFVSTLPQWLKLRSPHLDTVLFPAVSYPSYAMGATLAGCRAVAVPVDASWRLDLSAVAEADAQRALCLWVNTPGNPAGGLDDLGAAAAWGRARGVSVFSDECYAELTWDGPPRSILEHGLAGVVAVHSLSKRSNLAGLRAGFYAGDPELVTYLAEVRKHVGMMVPGPVQAAAVVAWGDDAHAQYQRRRYQERIERFLPVLSASAGREVPMPGGSFYLWAPAPDGDAWAFAEQLAAEGGVLVAPGDIYGPAGAGHVRAAMVHPLERLDLVARRLGLA